MIILITSWLLFSLGVAHVFFGIFTFKTAFLDALAEGFIDKFSQNDTRRLAFWFTLTGPLISLIGYVAVRSVNSQDYDLIKIIGYSTLSTSIIGILAFPKSPLWLLFLLSLSLIAGGYGWIH